VFSRGDEYWVEDLGSTNGTLVNGRKLTGPVPLQKGDRLQVGRTVLELRK
jgi:pSer/pThr/pTyr-binding forkhead associated (FHA) protein